MIEEVIVKIEPILEEYGCDMVTIAGGAVRDSMLGKQIKDYDVYINCPDINRKGILRARKSLAHLYPNGINAVFTPNKIYNNYYKDFTVRCYTIRNIDFIFMDCHPVKFIKEYFDIGLCECWFDFTTLNFCTTGAFDRDKNNKTLTVQIKPGMPLYSIGKSFTDHLPRLKKKFPDYKVLVEGI